MGLILVAFVAFGAFIGNYAETVKDINKNRGVPTAIVVQDDKLVYYKHDQYKPIPMKEVFGYMAAQQRALNDLCRQTNSSGNFVHVECARARGMYIPDEDVAEWNAAVGN